MKTQAWGWLTAAVLAAGLNASYHDGGLHWAHRIASRVERNASAVSAVLALATGRADQFLTEARVTGEQTQKAACPLTAALTRVVPANAQSEKAWSDAWSKAWSDDDSPMQSWSANSWSQENTDRIQARVQAWTDRHQAELNRVQARQVRLQTRLAHMQIPAVAINPVVVHVPNMDVCPRINVKVPEIPQVKIPVIHVDAPGLGPI